MHRTAPLAMACVFAFATQAATPQSLDIVSKRSGFDNAGTDHNVRPGDDFFAFANGGWDHRTPIPPDRSSIGTIGTLDDRSHEQVRAVLEEAARDPESRMGTAYRAFLDVDRIDRLGLAPVEALLAKLRAIGTRDAYFAAATDAGRRGVSLPLDFKVEPDDGDPEHYTLIISQAGLGMPDRDYYLAQTPAMQAIRAAYRRYIAAMLAIAGVTDAGAADRMIALETRIARASWTEAANGDAQRTYKRMSLGAVVPGLPRSHLPAFVRGLGYATDRAIVRQPDAAAAIWSLIESEKISTLRDMLIVRALHRYANALPADVRDTDFAFYGRTVDGIEAPEPRWRQAAAFVLDAMPDDVSRVYVSRHFSPETRRAAQDMVDNLVAAFRRRIDALAWMSPESKARARRKLAEFHAQIGYPGITVPMDRLNKAVVDHLEARLLDPARLEVLMDHILERRDEWVNQRREHVAHLERRSTEAEAKLKRLYDAIENGVIDVSDPSLKDRIAELTATRDQAKGDAERAMSHILKIGPAITPESLRAFAAALRKKLRNGDGTFARDQVRAVAQRVEVVSRKEVRIRGLRSELLRTLTAASGVEAAVLGVRGFEPKWRARQDSNLRPQA